MVRLAEFYLRDFSRFDRGVLHDELETYLDEMCSMEDFCELEGLGILAKKMVEKKKDVSYPLVYLLLKLALILLVATASVERSFSAMDIVKNQLRNRIEDDWMNDNLVTYIEKDVFDSVKNEAIMQCFQKMYPRRGQL